MPQKSFLNQVYPNNNPANWLVGPHVVAFNGAFGAQTLSTWVFPGGYYSDPNNLCIYTEPQSYDPECNYTHVQTQLAANGYDERQVQVVFLKSSTGNPQCDLKRTLPNCTSNGQMVTEDAYVSERLMGKIVRYLKCCKADGITTRYPKLKQVFITSRIYGGYADSSIHGCTINPEPFAYESGIAVQRLIVAQIKQAAGVPTNDSYSGLVDYSKAPWFDWGPYLWASGENFNSAGVNWCKGQGTFRCPSIQRDVRDGDIFGDPDQFWGDYTHPSAKGAEKVANQLVKFIQGTLPSPQANISNWVTPWITK